jgi:hypothetical protein
MGASTITKADCLRLKIYWGYMIKQNRNKQISEMMRAAKSPLEHLFDEHEFCGEWCKRKLQNKEERKAAAQYYRCKKKDAKLYAQLLALSRDFMTEKRLLESAHPYDTQVNEGMNSAVAKHAPKHKTYCSTSSLQNRVNIAVGVQVWGYKKYWGKVFGEIRIPVSSAVDDFLTSQDNSRNKRKIFKQQKDTKQKRIKRVYEKMKEECAKTKKDLEDGKGYGDDKGCDLDGNMVSTCECPGCPGKKNHKTAKSKECIWHQKFIGVTASKTREAIDKLTEQYSPVGGIDATDLLADIVRAAPVTITDAAAALRLKFEDYARNEANKTAENDGIGVDPTSKNLPGLALCVLINDESAGTSTSSSLVDSLPTSPLETNLLVTASIDKNPVPQQLKKDESNLVGAIEAFDIIDTLEL